MEILLILILTLVIAIVGIYLATKLSKKDTMSWEEKRAMMEVQLQENYEKVSSMNSEELALQEDDNVISAMLQCVETKARAIGKGKDSYLELSEQEQTAYIIYDFIDFVYDDHIEPGLRSFLGSLIRDYSVPRISNALATIGAHEHKQVFDAFVADNRIDVTDLSQFAYNYDEDFQKQKSLYNFSNADAQLHELGTLEGLLARYVRENMDCFRERC